MDVGQPLLCTRRTAIAGGLAAAAWPSFAGATGRQELVAGTYSREGGQGLYPLSSVGSDWKVNPAVASIANISAGVHSSRFGLLYLLAETAQGTLTVYDRAFKGLATRSTAGSGPAHAALSPDQSAIAVANYSSGSVAFWRLDKATGLPLGEAQLAQHAGHGPNASRQTGPHAHWVGFSKDSRWLHSVDLGADAIFVHRYGQDASALGEARVAYSAPPGSGPRHLGRHPRLPIAYLVSELASTLTVLRADEDGTFRAINIMSTLPAGFSAPSFAAHIIVNAAGTRVYVSNRGHNSVAVFALAPDGAASLMQHVDCGGDWPRFFLLMEQRRELLVANEKSGTIARFVVEADGRLRDTSARLVVPGVVFLAATQGHV